VRGFFQIAMPLNRLLVATLSEEDRRYRVARHNFVKAAFAHARPIIRERDYLTSQALLPAARAPWHSLDKEGTDINFLNTVGFPRHAFDELAHAFARHYVV